jgi:predicted acetyltransferase
MSVRLRPLRPGDELAMLRARRELAAEDFDFVRGYEDGMVWAEFLDVLEHRRIGLELPDGEVPTTFLAAVVSGELVGRASVRHCLNDFLAHEGGHIGFAVRPQHRRKGYAGAILREALVIVRSLGVERVLVTCAEDNVASAIVIERCAGVLDSVVAASDGHAVRRYWID